jgi:hypothetical protein
MLVHRIGSVRYHTVWSELPRQLVVVPVVTVDGRYATRMVWCPPHHIAIGI